MKALLAPPTFPLCPKPAFSAQLYNATWAARCSLAPRRVLAEPRSSHHCQRMSDTSAPDTFHQSLFTCSRPCIWQWDGGVVPQPRPWSESFLWAVGTEQLLPGSFPLGKYWKWSLFLMVLESLSCRGYGDREMKAGHLLVIFLLSWEPSESQELSE